jgi:hypothetical protein
MVVDHLILAAAACSEVRAAWSYSLGCWLYDAKEVAFRRDFDRLLPDHEGEREMRIAGEKRSAVETASDA